ncbi:hypothetical protein [Gimesia algae]|uniref:Uncharacterized protein n=1 Tax=Gimesia algae TaxID=2527971 RepID=A0A517V7X4_9PLAN|nr:hypothetical protein [Gimesia algae]QDT89107.1 hypothetical protein Pan161_07320 [Gimesia algae]
MMVLLNVIFLLALFFMTFAVIAAVVWGCLYLAGIRHKRRWLIGSFAVYCLCLVMFDFILSRPAAVFERTFGFAPTAEVIELESSIWILGDEGKITIAFIGNRETVEQILKAVCRGNRMWGSPSIITATFPGTSEMKRKTSISIRRQDASDTSGVVLIRLFPVFKAGLQGHLDRV